MDILLLWVIGLYFLVGAFDRFNNGTYNKYTIWIIGVSSGALGVGIGAAVERIVWITK